MNVGGIPFRTIWLADYKWAVHVIDQRKLPHKFVTARLESLEDAARREALEETGLNIELLCQFHTYSAPSRDARQHNISTVFIAKADGTPKAGSDAKQAQVFITLPQPLVFDHAKILEDYFQWLKNGRSERI